MYSPKLNEKLVPRLYVVVGQWIQVAQIIDVMPTLLGLCGGEVPAGVQGGDQPAFPPKVDAPLFGFVNAVHLPFSPHFHTPLPCILISTWVAGLF